MLALATAAMVGVKQGGGGGRQYRENGGGTMTTLQAFGHRIVASFDLWPRLHFPFSVRGKYLTDRGGDLLDCGKRPAEKEPGSNK